MPHLFFQALKSIVAERAVLDPLAPSPLSYATVAALFPPPPPPPPSSIDLNGALESELLAGSAHGTNSRPGLILPAHVVVLVLVSFVTLLWYGEAFDWKSGIKRGLSKVPQRDRSTEARASPSEAEKDEEGLPQSDQLQSKKIETKEPIEGNEFYQGNRQRRGSTVLLIQQARARLAGSLLPRIQEIADEEGKAGLSHSDQFQSCKTQTKESSEENTIHQRSCQRHGSIVLLLQQAEARLAGSLLPRGQETADEDDEDGLTHAEQACLISNANRI